MVKVDWDDEAVMAAMAQAEDQIQALTAETAARANAMGSGFRTGLYYPDHKSPPIGDTAPEYAHDVRTFRNGYPVGIVYTGNYSAMRDNHENNTLLKSRR